MAPHRTFLASASTSSAASASAAAFPPPPGMVVAPPPMMYPCKYCGKEYKTKQAASGHYNIHRKLPPETHLELGSANSRVRRRILKEENERRDLEYKKTGWARAKAEAASASGLTTEGVQQLLQQASVSSARSAVATGPDGRGGPGLVIRSINASVSSARSAAAPGPLPGLVIGPSNASVSSARSAALGPKGRGGPGLVIGSSKPPPAPPTTPSVASSSKAAPRVDILGASGSGAQGNGGAGSSSDPRSPNYWKYTGPVIRVQGPGGLLIRKATEAEIKLMG